MKTNRLTTLRSALTRLRDVQQVPNDIVEAAIALHQRQMRFDIFHLRAAASDDAPQGLVCTSQSGLLTLEIFMPRNQAGPPTRGQVLLSVHADHQAAFEGRRGRIYIITEDGERVLAEGPIHHGELLADIDVAGLDLTRRDAINIRFDVPIVRPS